MADQGRQIGACAAFRFHRRLNRFHRLQLVHRPTLALIVIDVTP
ncbi:hypothetical protein FHS51_004055 [Sphingobium wenxiniae]|uniref:Uncharacterized protein n=1 Tax=Sphingobium scionense TaxID=1404341 RepID=A0A7W6LWN0_9SPHN|nr:hypothetical protein [Sphingobium scionense]MBB6193797.1 hypothetical protein [Sphingobium wenxiniae]